jgi:hypothetical protein
MAFVSSRDSRLNPVHCRNCFWYGVACEANFPDDDAVTCRHCGCPVVRSDDLADRVRSYEYALHRGTANVNSVRAAEGLSPLPACTFTFVCGGY